MSKEKGIKKGHLLQNILGEFLLVFGELNTNLKFATSKSIRFETEPKTTDHSCCDIVFSYGSKNLLFSLQTEENNIIFKQKLLITI